MKVRFLEVAQAEFEEAVRYYETQQRGLGNEFREEVRAAIKRIRRFPEAWHPLSKRTRRCRTHRFPYGLIYQIREDEIIIVAVAHLHRAPEHWRDRVR